LELRRWTFTCQLISCERALPLQLHTSHSSGLTPTSTRQIWTQNHKMPTRLHIHDTPKCLAYQKVHSLRRKQKPPKNTPSNSCHNRCQHNQTPTHASRHRITICFLFSTKSRLRLGAHTFHERNQARGKTAPLSRQT
jgi:hypothetical protein